MENEKLISKKVIWRGNTHTIVDVHNTYPFVMLDDENKSVVGLDWGELLFID